MASRLEREGNGKEEEEKKCIYKRVEERKGRKIDRKGRGRKRKGGRGGKN